MLPMAATLSAAIVTENSTQEKVVSLWCDLLGNCSFELGMQAAKVLILSLMHQA